MRFLLPILLAALPAFSITITYNPSMPRLFQNIEVNMGGNVISANAGQIGVLLNGAFPALMYCADPTTYLATGPTAVSAVPASAFANGGRLAWLYNTYNPTLTTGLEAAALQLAIWEVVMDNNNDDLSAGLSQVTGNTNATVVSLATSMLQASAGQTSAGITFWVPAPGAGPSQTLLNGLPGSLVVPTPEPSAALLLGAGLITLRLLRRRI